jgi:selenide,water dikinase
MKRVPIFKDLVLVGGGHTHALVLRKWAMNPLPGVRITLISPQAMTPYSGMLPGLIAGHYSFEQTHIDLVKLSLWANIRFIQDSVTAIDVQSSTLALKNRPDIEFDAVSIDIGSTPNQQIEGTAEFTTAVRSSPAG